MESKASRRGVEAITPGATGADAGRPTPYAASDAELERRAAEGDYPAMVELQRRESSAAMEREQGCTCADEIVAMNNRGDYVGHESSCPRHWQLVDETSAWEDDDDA